METLLSEAEVRVLGSLAEKQVTTPDYYPLTMNALVHACNQISNRDPVVQYEERQVAEAVDSLRLKNLVYIFYGADSRVPKYKHMMREVYSLSPQELAVMCVLMLRGPQTVGEIRGRTGRLYEFADLAEVEATLDGLARRDEGPLVVRLPRQPGRKDSRYAHTLAGVPEVPEEAAAAEIEHIIQNMDREIETRFEATFWEARRAFSTLVPRMMEGATGELSLSEEGVEIGLKLKGRGWRPLRVLSGGERSLLALSFLFSIFLGWFGAGPKAFCLLDEAEAALDDLNLARFLTVVDSYRADGQFLLVTHQKRTMAAADVLYGVTPDTSGATVVVSKRLTGD